jgi:DNA repair protein RecO (recombination protein O)
VGAELLKTEAVLLRRTAYRDADLLLSLFTQRFGKITALARAARRSQRRFSGALEPMHGLSLELSSSGQRFTLEGANIAQFRSRLTGSLPRMNAAARALAWVRDVAPEGQPEDEVWEALEAFLQALDLEQVQDEDSLLASTGLQLLRAFGWALELDCCVSCGRACPPGKAAMLDPSRGGLVCAACGGAKWTLSGEQRSALLALTRSLHAAVDRPNADLGLRIVDAVFEAHAKGA